MPTLLLLALAIAAPPQAGSLDLAFSVPGVPGELGGLFVRPVGDVDGDGVTDLGVYAYGTTNDAHVRVLSGLDRRVLHDFGQVATPFVPRAIDGAGDVDGDGLADLLVGDAAAGTAAVRSGATGGELCFVVDLATPPLPAATITPGSTWSFQVWFRDQGPSGATSGISDATQVQFRP